MTEEAAMSPEPSHPYEQVNRVEDLIDRPGRRGVGE